MSNRDIFPFDWSRNFFTRSRDGNRGSLYERDFFGFDDIENEMNRVLDLYNNIQSNIPKELVREYQTENGDTVKEVGPIVYGYSMKIGPDGKPRVREFGNVRTLANKNQGGGENFHLGPKITNEREPKVVLSHPVFEEIVIHHAITAEVVPYDGYNRFDLVNIRIGYY